MSGFVFERDSKSEKKRKKEGKREMEKGTMVKKRESRRVGMYVVRHFHTKYVRPCCYGMSSPTSWIISASIKTDHN